MIEQTISPNARTPNLAYWATAVLLGLYIVLQVTHAWVVDDAYITLRTVDNFVHGYGLRWNPTERVQSYTHPFWMFVLSAFYFVTRESFYTTIVVSFLVSLAAVWLVLRGAPMRAASFRTPLFLGVLLGSKSFLDYSSSGLENPLTHLLLAAFFLRFFDERPSPVEHKAGWLATLAALSFVNRMDTLLLVTPACAYLLFEQRAALGKAVRYGLLGALPALLWVMFAFFYYGSVVPNTAIAKLTGPRVTLQERFLAGVAYFADSMAMDPLTLLACGVAIALCFASRKPRPMMAAAGITLYLFYVLTTAAIGTHMSGRFFSGALFLSAILIALEATHLAQALGTVAITTAWLIGSPVSPLRVGHNSYAHHSDNGRPIIDTRAFVLAEGAGLLSLRPGEPMPNHPWYRAGKDFRHSPQRVHEGGLIINLAIGYSGFASGPEKHFIDILGLSDPLIAHLPLPRRGVFRPGHFFHEIPAGYLASIERDENLIEDPDLHRYYDAIRLITRGDLFSGERLSTLLKFAVGNYDPFLDAYASRHDLRLH